MFWLFKPIHYFLLCCSIVECDVHRKKPVSRSSVLSGWMKSCFAIARLLASICPHLSSRITALVVCFFLVNLLKGLLWIWVTGIPMTVAHAACDCDGQVTAAFQWLLWRVSTCWLGDCATWYLGDNCTQTSTVKMKVTHATWESRHMVNIDDGQDTIPSYTVMPTETMHYGWIFQDIIASQQKSITWIPDPRHSDKCWWVILHVDRLYYMLTGYTTCTCTLRCISKKQTKSSSRSF